MKKSLSFGVGMTYAGCFLGAGYVSGQELWKFFGNYGNLGIVGLTVTMILFFLLGSALFLIVYKTKISMMDRVIAGSNNKILLMAVSFLQFVYFICIYLLMAAGIGSLFETCFGISKYISTAVFCAIITVLAFGGVERMMKVFSVTVPLLVVTAVLFCMIFLAVNGFNFNFKSNKAESSGFGWILSSLIYMSFNFFGAIGIMAPVNVGIKSKKIGIIGVLTGVIMLFLIALSVIFALLSDTFFAKYDLPMLNLSFSLGKAFGYIYAVLLLLAMTGTSLSCLIASDHYLTEKSKIYKSGRMFFLAAISVACFFCSLYGFGNLIGAVYPVFGYVGFAIIVLFLANCLKTAGK